MLRGQGIKAANKAPVFRIDGSHLQRSKIKNENV